MSYTPTLVLQESNLNHPFTAEHSVIELHQHGAYGLNRTTDTPRMKRLLYR